MMSPGLGGWRTGWLRRGRPGPVFTWRRDRSWARVAAWALGAVVLVFFCLFLGLFSVQLGDLADQRLAFAFLLPMFLAIVFLLFISPRGLLVGILLIRAGTNQVLFEGAQFAGMGGLGGMLNLAVIVLTLAFVAQDPKRVPRPVWMVWVPFVVMQFGGLIHSPDLMPSVRNALANLSSTMLFIAAFYFVDDLKSLHRMLKLLVWCAVPVVGVGIWTVATGQTAGALDDPTSSSAGRYAGPFNHPNIMAFYLVLMIGVVLYLWKATQATSQLLTRMFHVSFMLVMFGLLLATKTRSAWVAAFMMVAMYGVFVERRFLVYLVLAMVAAMAVPEVRERVLALGEGNEVVQYARLNSFAWRKVLWESALTWMGKAQYLAGYGYGSFMKLSTIFFPLAGGREWGAHSVLVQAFFELGVLGLLAWTWLYGRLFMMFSGLWRCSRPLAITAMGQVAMYYVVSASDNMLGYLVFNWYYWFALGAMLRFMLVWQADPVRAGQPVQPVAAAVRRRPVLLQAWRPVRPR
ncbi:MAG: hypothetical protein RIQ53_261 [Pseudomonadota bacterium]|jgi:hypothetical protein